MTRLSGRNDMPLGALKRTQFTLFYGSNFILTPIVYTKLDSLNPEVY